ncbi:MAG: T9SS type A sorting domain-containing protein [Bacteroidota bacterium]
MRLVSALLTLLLALPASGQDAVPDTTDPASYYPLEIGNRWESRLLNAVTPGPTHFRTMIVADTMIDAEPWFIRRKQGFRSVERRFTLVSDVREPVRFDPEAATVVRWTGTEAVRDFPCRLDGPLTGDHGSEPDCDPAVYASYDKRERAFGLGGGSRMAVSFDGAVPGPTFYAGIGEDGYYTDLVYVRVGNETYGEPIEGMPNLPDPTPPWMYYPLAVGNVWEYEVFDPGGAPVSFTRRALVSDSTVASTPYVVETLRRLQPGGVWGDVDRTELLRFDSTSGRIVSLTESGDEWPVSCPLGADFHAYIEDDPLGCRDASANPFAPNQKAFSRGAMGSIVYQRGVGPWQDTGSSSELRLSYARVGNLERGTPYPVAADDAPNSARLGVRLSPNPASGPVAVRLALAEAAAVTVEAFDALGRRVARTEAVLPAGPQRLDLDAAAWVPGLYVVRVTAGGATASGTVVRC